MTKPPSISAWLVPSAAACAFVAVLALDNLPGLNGDTVVLVHGAHTIADCLTHGIHSYCDRHGAWMADGRGTFVVNGILEGAVGPYALFQYLPALLMTQLGLSDHHVYDGLALISLVSFCALVGAATWTASRTARRWAPPVVALILTTSPLMYYAGSTFGESLGALLVGLLAVAALQRRRPALLALCAALACLTKDTVFPVVAMLGAVSLWVTPIGSGPVRRGHWLGLGLGIALGVAASAAFNWFRYGQLTNYAYLHSFDQVPGLLRRLGNSAALWISPNGGLAIFWPLAAAAILALVAIVTSQLRERPRRLGPALPGVTISASALLVTGTLASWWSPFGWVAWGPRLMLLTTPATVLIVIVVYGEQLERLLRQVFATRVRTSLTAGAAVIAALPQSNILNSRNVVFSLFSPDATCPTLPSVLDTHHYYHCLNHWAWGRHWILLDTFRALGHPRGVIFAAAFVAVWVALVWAAIGPSRLAGSRVGVRAS